ncbi:hypothetical protein BDW74DRAFT_50260 [Aspergillus multicolor]|uniref:uncharacterized protein n=1 Tax=Aspergillus multicolor TaxID=41759 RepID=UPI003CCE24F7
MFVHFVFKQTFLLFYLRLSPNRRFQCAVYSTMVICVVFLTVEWLLAFLQARPLAAYFHPEDYPNAKRLSEYVVQMVPTAFVWQVPDSLVARRANLRTLLIPPVWVAQNAFSDIVILILPAPTVLNLQMSTRRKITVLGIICFSSLSVVTALCRFVVQKQLISESDTSYIMGRMVIVAGIEIQIAVVAVNLPALRSLFTNMLGSSHEASGSYPYSSQKGVHRPSSLKPHSESLGVRRGLRKPEPRDGALGATLTGSEEELMRQQGGSTNHIHVITNVDVTSHDAVDEDCGRDMGLASMEENKHVHWALGRLLCLRYWNSMSCLTLSHVITFCLTLVWTTISLRSRYTYTEPQFGTTALLAKLASCNLQWLRPPRPPSRHRILPRLRRAIIPLQIRHCVHFLRDTKQGRGPVVVYILHPSNMHSRLNLWLRIITPFSPLFCAERVKEHAAYTDFYFPTVGVCVCVCVWFPVARGADVEHAVVRAVVGNVARDETR